MRLIDADKYKKQLCENCISKLKYGETFCPCGRVLDIDYFPTAYNVDKVVEELESAEYPFYLYDADGCDVDESLLKADMVESIVRRGGTDEIL